MSVEALIRRDRVVTAAGLLVVTALAWLHLFREPMSASATEGREGAAARGAAPMASEAHASYGSEDSGTEADPDLPS